MKPLQIGDGHGDDGRAELDDQIGLFGQWHEFGRIEFAQTRMLPTHQRLVAGNLLVSHGVDGLILQRQLALFDGQPQIGFKHGALAAVGAQIGREGQHRVAALAAGAVHGDFGIVQHTGGCRRRVPIMDGKADGGCRRDLDAADLDQRSHGDAHAFRQHLQFLLGPLRQHENAELVGADAGQRFARPDQMRQAAGQRDQQAIGFEMLRRGGHSLETINVDDDDCRLDQRLALRAGQRHAKPVEE